MTHPNAEIWEVGLDNDEVIRCTGNHPFLTRDGKWIKAEDLQPDQSLMPLYRSRSGHGYEKTYNPASGSYE